MRRDAELLLALHHDLFTLLRVLDEVSVRVVADAGTTKNVVDRIITNLGVLDVVEGGLKIVECADGVTEDELRAATEATIV